MFDLIFYFLLSYNYFMAKCIIFPYIPPTCFSENFQYDVFLIVSYRKLLIYLIIFNSRVQNSIGLRGYKASFLGHSIMVTCFFKFLEVISLSSLVEQKYLVWAYCWLLSSPCLRLLLPVTVFGCWLYFVC